MAGGPGHVSELQLVSGLAADGRCLVLNFQWVGDRYQQRLSIRSATGEISPVFETCEGTSADDWPAAPPLQQVHLQPDGQQRQMALGLGMAGASHWSVSVLAEPDRARLEWEVACRMAPGQETMLRCCFRPVGRIPVAEAAVAEAPVAEATVAGIPGAVRGALQPQPLAVPGGETIWRPLGDGGGEFCPAQSTVDTQQQIPLLGGGSASSGPVPMAGSRPGAERVTIRWRWAWELTSGAAAAL